MRQQCVDLVAARVWSELRPPLLASRSIAGTTLSYFVICDNGRKNECNWTSNMGCCMMAQDSKVTRDEY